MQISADFLAMSGEPAILAKNSKIVFANNAAQSALGSDCTGKSLSSVFGAELSEAQASAFVLGLSLNGRDYICRVTRDGDITAVFFFSPEASQNVLNDAFIYSLKNGLMSYGIAADMARHHAEDTGDTEMLRLLASMSQSYYRARRNISNLTIMRNAFEKALFLNAHNFDLRELASATADTINAITKRKIISLTDGKPISVYADSAMVEQLLLNLISNCLTHAKGCSSVKISLTETKENTVIAVADNGCGIEPENMHSVFDRYRHGFDMTDLGSGAGLGLSVVQTIANLHGGTLLLESKPGRGTSVRVSLSRRSSAALSLGSGGDSWQPEMDTILVGLADCLPPDCFSEKYTD